MPRPPRVYAIQDSRTVDLSPALRYGEVQTILPPGDSNFSVGDTIRRLKEGLYEITPADYVLLVGDPLALALTGLVLYEQFEDGQVIQFLKWNRQTREYLVLRAPVDDLTYGTLRHVH